jgi:hypothetical protein
MNQIFWDIFDVMHRDGKQIINCEWVRIWKGEVVTYLKILAWQSSAKYPDKPYNPASFKSGNFGIQVTHITATPVWSVPFC